MKLGRWLAIAVLAALLALPAAPQASTASVSGTVRDQSGAVIPNAAVVLTNTGTNVASRTVTNEVGFYAYPSVNPGPYRLDVEVSGMQRFQATITVQVGQSVPVNPVMLAAGTSTTITVQDATPIVIADKPSLGSVLESNRIQQLPINGRNLTTLLATVPGMEGTRGFGAREGSTEIVLDGSPIADRTRGGSMNRQPGLDSVQEFAVEGNGASARYPRPTTVLYTTKSGTNQVHGSLFETHRNNGIGKARSKTDTNAKPPQLIRNEYGGTFGGPVVLPKVYNGKDKTFFFFSYEGSRLISATTKGYSVPTDAMRNGDFSGLLDKNGRLLQLYDPNTTNASTYQRQQFSYGGRANVIDPNRASPVWKYLMSITPKATLADVNPLVASNWFGPVVGSRDRTYTISTRVDHRFSERDNAYFRYTRGDYTHYYDNYGVPLSDGGANNINLTEPNYSAVASWVRTVSPTLFNELILTASRTRRWEGQKNRDTDFASMLNLPNPFASAAFPVINTIGFSDLKYQPANTNAHGNTFYVVDDNVTKIHGKHELQFGFHARWDYLNILPDQQTTAGTVLPAANFTALWDSAKATLGSPVAVPQTGYGIGSLYLGAANYMLRLNHNTFYMRSKEYAGYFQDNWRVSPRLSLYLGIRYDVWPPYKEKYGNLSSFDTAKHAIVLTQPLSEYYRIGSLFPGVLNRMQQLGATFETYEQAGMNKNLLNGNYKDFGPRVGATYRLWDSNRAAILRGSFRMSYFPIPLRTWTEYSRSTTPFTSFLYYNMDDTAQSPDGYPSWTLRNAPQYTMGVNTRNIIDPKADGNMGITRPLNVNYFDPNMRDTRMMDWNVTLEKEIVSNTVLRVTYFGNHTDGLDQYYNFNASTPSYVWAATQGVNFPSGEYGGLLTRPFDQKIWGQIQEYGKWGWSNNSGATFEVQRRFSKGFSYQFFYTLNRSYTAGGWGWNDGWMYSTNNYMPGSVPTDFNERNKALNYTLDDSLPKHRVAWNWLIDMPFGKGKAIGRNSGKFLNAVIGGWQLAGMGSLRSNWMSLGQDYWPTGNKVEVYGYKYPIEDCRSGKCYPGYLWYNGYIPANQINSYDKNGKPNGVMGVPDSYKPAAAPLIPTPKNPQPGDPLARYYESNTVFVSMKDGRSVPFTYSPGAHPWMNQFVPGIRTWKQDASLFKVFDLGERFKLRLNADFINVFNTPGNSAGSYGTDGIQSARYSGNTPRELQLTLRLQW